MIGLVLAHWKGVGLAVLLVALTTGAAKGWHDKLAAERRAGVATERVRVADSTLAVLRAMKPKVETTYVHDSIIVRRTVTQTIALHDTVLAHLTDTLLVKQYVNAADSAARACNVLLGSCAQRQSVADATIVALERKVAALPVAVCPERRAEPVTWTLAKYGLTFIAGAGAGYAASR